MRYLLTATLGAVLALSSATRAQTFTVTPYGPTCGPIATGTVTSQGNTNRFVFTVTNCAPSEFVFHIVGVNEIAYPIHVGMNCLILKGVRIGQGSVVGAGAVLTRDVPPGATAAGNPARIMRRD